MRVLVREFCDGHELARARIVGVMFVFGLFERWSFCGVCLKIEWVGVRNIC